MKQALAGAAGATIAGSLLIPKHCGGSAADIEQASPIAILKDPLDLRDFNGDEFSRPHAILWDKPGYLSSKGGIPPVSERQDFVIAGGGMSGLTSAYLLRNEKPIVLDQATRFGGNSKGERWGSLEYSIGAAYITNPSEGSFSRKLVTELGLLPRTRFDDPREQIVLLKGKSVAPFWQGVTDPARKEEFVRVWKGFEQVREHGYPDIPWNSESQLSQSDLEAMDRVSYAEWIRQNWGVIHPHIEEFIQEYCWSSFGAAFTEISAAQGHNFLAADLGGTLALPGGNSAITRELYYRLEKRLPKHALRTGCFVVDITQTSDGVQVCYEEPTGALKTILAKRCVVALPKFAAKTIVSGVSEPQLEAMGQLSYRAFVVANVLLKKKTPSPAYEIYRVEGEPLRSVRDEMRSRVYTDMTFGNWASHDQGDHSNVTLYCPFAYEEGRRELFDKSAHSIEKAKLEKVVPTLMKSLGVAETDILGMRLTRWGHALPVAATGLLASGTLARSCASINNRIFFAHQDNWANPCFETAINSARRAVEEIQKKSG